MKMITTMIKKQSRCNHKTNNHKHDVIDVAELLHGGVRLSLLVFFFSAKLTVLQWEPKKFVVLEVNFLLISIED